MSDPTKTQVGGDHYTKMAMQPEAFIHANGIPFHEGNAIKYLCRWRSKSGVQDLHKAIHYIELLIKHEVEAEERRDPNNWCLINSIPRHVLNEVAQKKPSKR